jgi:hypothetical protein
VTSPHVDYPLVLVTWLDAVTDDTGWLYPVHDTSDAEYVYSAGFLVKKTEKAVIIALSAGEDAFNGTIAIPKGMIVKIETLRKAHRRRKR